MFSVPFLVISGEVQVSNRFQAVSFFINIVEILCFADTRRQQVLCSR